MEPNDQLMQETFKYDEEWEVWITNVKTPFILNEKEFAVLSEAMMAGSRGIIQFKDKSIAIPYVVATYRKSRKLKPEFQLQAPAEEPYKELTPEELAERRVKIAEIRKKLGIRLSVSKK